MESTEDAPGRGDKPNGLDDLKRFEARYRVRFDEAGADGALRPSGYVRYAQDVAWQHSDARGFDRPWYAARGVVWLVRWVQLELVGSARFGSTVSVSTRVSGGRRALARRHTEVRAENGQLLATALTDWILLSETGRPARVPPEIVESFSDGSTFAPGRVVLGPPPEDAHEAQIQVRPQEVDPMRHVNNAAYLDYLDEVLAGLDAGGANRAETGPQQPFVYELEYLRPARPAEPLSVTAWSSEDGWAVTMRGEIGDEVLRSRVRARVRPGVQ